MVVYEPFSSDLLYKYNRIVITLGTKALDDIRKTYLQYILYYMCKEIKCC